MITVRIKRKHTNFTKHMPDHKIIASVGPTNKTLICAIPLGGKPQGVKFRDHETRAHAMCYIANALNITQRI